MPLTSTTVTELWACGSLVGIGLCTFTYSMYNIVDNMGAPLLLLCNGPTPWQCSQGYLVDPAAIVVVTVGGVMMRGLGGLVGMLE